MRPAQIAVSPCSNPELALDDALAAYAALGYRSFEAFTSWVASALDPRADPAGYAARARRHGIAFTSLHLPRVEGGRLEETLREAVAAAAFADALGAEVVLFKAGDRPTYIRAAPAFLDAVAGLRVVPVIQNHFGTPLSSLEDVLEVRRGVGDPRLRSLLEVGHFHSAGVPWRAAAEALGEAVALVHVKDQVGPQSVPFGTGEIDLPGLVRHLDGRGYRGRYVVEMEVADRPHTLAYLGQALDFMTRLCGGTP